MAILPETDMDGAKTFAERIREGLAIQPYVANDESIIPLRMSFGIATCPQDARQGEALVAFADSNLYESKQRGGNFITSAGETADDGAVKLGNYSVLDGLVTAVDRKDRYTRKHSEDVTAYALALARAIGLSEENLRTVRIAALLHDLGKIGVPDQILRKPGKLDAAEYEIVKQHAVLGEMIIKDVPNLPDVLDAVVSHHERYDGSGYPRGLKGEDIPLLGRILAVADAYSAMTSDRPYRQAKSRAEAEAELLRVAGTHLDAQLVEVFVSECLPGHGETLPKTG